MSNGSIPVSVDGWIDTKAEFIWQKDVRDLTESIKELTKELKIMREK